MENEQTAPEMAKLVPQWNEIAESISLKGVADADKDMIWCVTRMRTGAYLLFSSMGLISPDGQAAEWDVIKDTFRAVLINYFFVAAQHPARIEYAPDNIQTPRLDILNATLSVYEQLTSDENVRDSACELVRIVATSEDSNHEKIGYATLIGLLLKIVEWMYPSVNVNDVVMHLFDAPAQPAE